MPQVRPLSTPIGLRPGDHVCWSFTGPDEFTAAVVPYLVEGCQRGEQLLLEGRSKAEMLSLLAGWGDRDRLLSSGQLSVRTGIDRCSGPVGLDAGGEMAVFRKEAERARRRGWSGLRVAADVTVLARDGASDHARLHLFELRADELMANTAITGLCLYDEGLGEAVLGQVAVLHAGQRARDEVSLVHLSARGPTLSLHGELDVNSAAHVLPVLVDAAVDAADGSRGITLLDLTDLAFLDVAGARALVTGHDLLAGRGVRLEFAHPRRVVHRCLELFGQALHEGAW